MNTACECAHVASYNIVCIDGVAHRTITRVNSDFDVVFTNCLAAYSFFLLGHWSSGHSPSRQRRSVRPQRSDAVVRPKRRDDTFRRRRSRATPDDGPWSRRAGKPFPRDTSAPPWRSSGDSSSRRRTYVSGCAETIVFFLRRRNDDFFSPVSRACGSDSGRRDAWQSLRPTNYFPQTLGRRRSELRHADSHTVSWLLCACTTRPGGTCRMSSVHTRARALRIFLPRRETSPPPPPPP